MVARYQGGQGDIRKESESRSVVSDSLRPQTIQPMEFSRPEYWSGQPFPSPGDLSNPGKELRSSTLQADSLPAEAQGKPKNTGVGSLSLLQQIFPTQESNWSLLHCRQILYQLSYQGSGDKRRWQQKGSCGDETILYFDCINVNILFMIL